MVPQLSITPLMLLTIGCQGMLKVSMPFIVTVFNRTARFDFVCG